jgi:hypothetical protein
MRAIRQILFCVFCLAASAVYAVDPLEITTGSRFTIEYGGTSTLMQFPFLSVLGTNVFVGFSEHSDVATSHNVVDALATSRDGGTNWPGYTTATDIYMPSLIRLSNGNLWGMNYITEWVTSTNCTGFFRVSTNDGQTWSLQTGNVAFPQAAKPTGGTYGGFVFHRTAMQMSDGSIQASMYGWFASDTLYRCVWVKSTDGGSNWTFVSTIAYDETVGPEAFCEPVVARCADNSLLCVMRTGMWTWPLYQCRSTNDGLSWSTPTTLPGVALSSTYSVDPDLCLMSSGVLALSFGRPNCQMLFSLDGCGTNWGHYTSTYVSTYSSGYTGVREVSPGRLLVVGDDGADWANPPTHRIWGMFVDVTPHVFSTVSNGGGASNITDVSATLNGEVIETVGTTVVSVYWGTADHGTNTVGWDHVGNFGQRTAGPLSTNVTGLIQGTTYYYRFSASNSVGMSWASPAAQFKTVASPTVDNGSGAVSIAPRSAQLTGSLTAGGNANIYVYWGTTDGGTTPSNWQHTNSIGATSEGAFSCNIGGLNPITAYSYRCYATNVAGGDWANSTASFQTTALLSDGSAGRMKITFAGYNKTEALTNFPALVVLGTNLANFAYGQFATTNGYDLRFLDASETTNLNYEIEQWNIGGQSLVWVQVPLIQNNTDYIWAYWGKVTATNQQACTTNGATWNSDFKGVWHLATSASLDSTPNRNNGTINGNVTADTGQIDGADKFYEEDGNDYVEIANSATLENVQENNFTIEGWFKPRITPPGSGSAPDADWGILIKPGCHEGLSYTAGNTFRMDHWLANPQTDVGASSANTFSIGVWHHVVGVVDRVNGLTRIYVDGQLQGTSTAWTGGAATYEYAQNTWKIGIAAPSLSTWTWGADGSIDEVRISSVCHSADWIWACYMAAASNSQFSSYEVQTGSTSTAATVHGIPYSWLGSYGIANTNDSVETENPDGDGLNNLQEYIAGTDPTNRDSCFSVSITNMAGQIVIRVPSIQASGGKTRYYDIEQRSNLLTGSWQLVPGYTGIVGNGSFIACTNATQDQAEFYRVKARLLP